MYDHDLLIEYGPICHIVIADYYDTPIFVSKYFTYHFVSSIRDYLEGFEYANIGSNQMIK